MVLPELRGRQEGLLGGAGSLVGTSSLKWKKGIGERKLGSDQIWAEKYPNPLSSDAHTSHNEAFTSVCSLEFATNISL